MSAGAYALLQRLGLTEDELCHVFGTDPLAVLSGQIDADPRLKILLALTGEAEEKVGPDALRLWTQRNPQHQLLLDGDFAGFEDALTTLAERGLTITRDPGASRRARPQ
jgi:hypothetical protein